MKKVIVTGMVLILMLFLLPSCGVSQEDYDRASSDLTAAQSQIQSLQGDLTAVQGDLTAAEEKLAEALAYAEFLESVYAEFLDIPMYQAWLRVEVNQEFVIPLVSNPTTGYGWQASYDETMLELVEKTYEPGVAAKQGMVGAGGTELFRFRTLVEMGQTEITLVYKRPWEEPSPLDVTKVFTVNIVPTEIIVGPPPPPEPVTPGYIRVYDYILGYGFEYPENWESQVIEVIDGEDTESILMFTKPGTPTTLIVTVKLSNLTSLEEVKEEIREGLNKLGITILEEREIVVNGREGYEVIYRIPLAEEIAEEAVVKIRQVMFIANGKTYILICSTAELLYDEYEETFDHVINSFVIGLYDNQ